MTHLLFAIRSLERQIGSRLLTCEGEIILFLIENGPSRSRDILNNVNCSQVSVFNKLKEFKSAHHVNKINLNNNIHEYEISSNLMNSIYEIELNMNY